ncbi:MAG: hypothetical protein AAFX90_20825 [Pseudomonadota bacterium]
MSLIRLGSASTRRRFKIPPRPTIMEAMPGATPPPPEVTATQQETETETEKAFQQLVEYFPTETVTLFMAAVSLMNSFNHIPTVAAISPLWLVAVFTVFTPVMLLLAAFATHREMQARVRKADPDAPLTPFELPVFDLFASAIAFVPWALAVPGLFVERPSPDQDKEPDGAATPEPAADTTPDLTADEPRKPPADAAMEPTADAALSGWSADEAQVVAVFLAFFVTWLLSHLRRINTATQALRKGRES